jgi:hypothetical protein
MIIQQLSDLAPAPKRAVIVNVNTKWVTTLALLSTLRHAKMPILVIDCQSQDGSWGHFQGMMQEHGFDLLRAPLRLHGIALDWLFREIPAEHVLLVDSDAEILGRTILDIIEQDLDNPRVFGGGFIHGPEWMTELQTGIALPRAALYQERMWIPLAMLNVAKVREALAAGRSFAARMIYNDLACLPSVAQWLYGRFRHPRWSRSRLKFLDPFRRTYYGAKPSYVFCDTGADVFQYLRYERDYLYVGLPAAVHPRYVSHFHGVTRRVLDKQERNATAPDEAMPTILARLRDAYGVVPADA